MKRIPPYVVVALCGLLFISAGLIGMFANNSEEVLPVDPAAEVVVLPSETPTLTPTALPVEIVVQEPAPVVEQPPVEAAPVVVEAPVEVIQPTAVEIVPTEVVPVEGVPVDASPVVVVPVDIVPAEVVPVEGAPVDAVPVAIVTPEVVAPEQLPDGVVPIPTALPPIEVIPTEVIPVEVLPTEVPPVGVVPVEGVPIEGRDSIPLDGAAAPVATRGVPVDSVIEPTAEVPAAEVIVPEQPLPVDGATVMPTVDPAVLPTPEGVVATAVPVDAVNAAGTAQLSGLITFQDAQDHTGIVIVLTLPDGTQLQNITGAPGTFEFLSLRPGTYRVEAVSNGYLSRLIEITLAEGESLQLPATFLVGGDTNFDNIIDLSDAALVALNFDGPAVDLTSDPNRDGWIDVRDLALIGADYGLTGPIPWQ
jgi:hypothetical protein